ncbi:MAG: hypothetical protein WAM11_09125 [Cyanobium sp.]
MNLFSRSALALMGGTTLAFSTAGAALAGTNFVLNGSFETNGGVGQIGPNSGPNISLPDWTRTIEKDPGSQGFAFVINKDASTTGFPSVFSPPNIAVWGSPNSFPTGITTFGPDGDYWVGIDGDYGRSSIKQTIAGLTIGTDYELSFLWAGSQFNPQTGDTFQRFDYTIDGSSYSTNTVTVPSQGFEGWFNVSKIFTASSTSFELAFTAIGSAVSGSGALPPFLMLDNVKIMESSPLPPPPPPVPTQVPGPLPVVGAAVALSWSRRLRRRIGSAKLSSKA